jgi:glycosyltransferase involved in cell wall biosynthesis
VVTTHRPLVSICVPVYNKARLLPRLLESVARQGCEGLEVVAVDNASSDNSREVLDSWCDRLDLRIYSLPRTISAPENWLLALSLGTGEFLKLQLADDVVPDGAITRMLSVLQERPEIGFVFGRTRILDRDGRLIEPGSSRFRFWENVNRDRARMGSTTTLADRGRVLRTMKLRDAPLGDANSIMFRATLLPVLRQGVDSVAPAFTATTEHEIFLRLLAVGRPCFVDADTSYYSYDDDNFSARWHDEVVWKRSQELPSANVMLISLLDPTLQPLVRAAGRRYQVRLVVWQLAKAAKRATAGTRARGVWTRAHRGWLSARRSAVSALRRPREFPG